MSVDNAYAPPTPSQTWLVTPSRHSPKIVRLGRKYLCTVFLYIIMDHCTQVWKVKQESSNVMTGGCTPDGGRHRNSCPVANAARPYFERSDEFFRESQLVSIESRLVCISANRPFSFANRFPVKGWSGPAGTTFDLSCTMISKSRMSLLFSM